jgi:arginyl-tRNA--protein-N-Asp/Glu arginylyltransferase
MKLVFSEARSDYSQYLYPYVVWAFPEAGERPVDFFRRGFLPASPDLDRYYLCRNLRLPLAGWQPSSENRRVLRKGEDLVAELIPRAAFEYSPTRREAWKVYADRRFGEDVMSFQRLDRLMSSPVISHLLLYRKQATGQELGTALLFLAEPDVAYYYYAFYDLAHFARNLGLFMMTWAVGFFAARGVAHLHLGTCYSRRALYKTQFQGVQFCNGSRWSEDLEELKYLIERDVDGVGKHLLDVPAYVERFLGNDPAAAGLTSHWRLDPAPPPAR